MTMKNASGIYGVGQPIHDKVFMVILDRNQMSIIALLNYREFSFTKIEIFITTAFYHAHLGKSSAKLK